MLFLVDLTVDNKSKPHIFLIFAKETQHQLQTDICKHNKKKKKGSRFGLTKVLLAEGDAPFPFVRHRNTSLRRTLLLRKIMMLAQKDRENSKQQKTQNGELNDCQLSHSTAFWLPLGVWAGNNTLDWTDVFNHGVLSLRTCLRSRWRCDACACKGLALSAVLSCKEMICHENKT